MAGAAPVASAERQHADERVVHERDGEQLRIRFISVSNEGTFLRLGELELTRPEGQMVGFGTRLIEKGQDGGRVVGDG